MHKMFVDLGYGDSGKGVSVARAIIEEPTASIVKFSGGAQAAHNVVWGDKHHTFAQFGSGTFVPGVRTLLTNDFIIDPLAILREADHLQTLGVDDALSRLYISDGCRVITKAMVAANHAAERARGESRHGSTGRGIGMTVEYEALTRNGVRARDLSDFTVLREKIAMQHEWLTRRFGVVPKDDSFSEAFNLYSYASTWLKNIGPESKWVDQLNNTSSSLIFEGSQGILLDENIGWFPHVTRATTTSRNAVRILSGLGEDFRTYGVIRTYMTRHGAGPFPTDFNYALRDNDHNDTYEWAGSFRRGFLDIPALQYAMHYQHIDGLILTHADFNLNVALGDPYSKWAYEPLDNRARYTGTLFNKPYTIGPAATAHNISNLLEVPVVQQGYGPDVEDCFALTTVS